MKQIKRLPAGAFAAAILLLVMHAPARAQGQDDPVVIQLGDKTVTRSEFDSQFNVAASMLANRRHMTLSDEDPAQVEKLRKQYLEIRATELVLLQEADRRHITVSKKDIDAKVAAFLKALRGKSDETEKVTLGRVGIGSEDQLREMLREKEKIRQVTDKLQDEIHIRPGDVVEMHHDMKEQMATPEKVCVRQILVKSEDEAQKLKKELDNGADFAALARENSQDTQTAKNGGDMGCFEKGWEKAKTRFEQAAFDTEEGDIAGPVKSEFGYHIIKVYKHVPRHVPTLNEAYNEIETELKHERLPDKIAELRSGSSVKTYPDRLGKWSPPGQ